MKILSIQFYRESTLNWNPFNNNVIAYLYNCFRCNKLRILMEDVYDKNKYFTFIRFQILELTNVIEKCLSIFHISLFFGCLYRVSNYVINDFLNVWKIFACKEQFRYNSLSETAIKINNNITKIMRYLYSEKYCFRYICTYNMSIIYVFYVFTLNIHRQVKSILYFTSAW